MPSQAVRCAVAVLLTLGSRDSIAQEPINQNRAISQSAADIESGRILVGIACSTCHGIDGSGGRGPNLLGGLLRHGDSDDALFRNIQNGISGTGMSGFRWADAEVWQVVSYLQSQRRGATAAEVPGDAARGRQLFEKHNCASCHWTKSSGGRLGPDLARSRGSVEYTRRALVDPNADIDTSYEQILLVRNNGRISQGLRLNENTYYIQLIDQQENLSTISVKDIEELHRPNASTMPSYRTHLSAADADDLTKYLFSLRELP